MHFTHDEIVTLANALRIAAKQLTEDAKVFATPGDNFDKRMADGFAKQAADTYALLDSVEKAM